MTPPPPGHETVIYQVPRDELVRVLFRRMVVSRRRIRTSAVFLVAAVLFHFSYPQLRVLTYAIVAWVILLPFILRRGIARAIDQNPQFTDPKTLTFGPEGVLLVGPNYKSEMEWNMFKGFSEDASYFYLHLSDTGFDSVLPKSAFTPPQQELFRKLAPRRKG
jgi:hypothetical protein